MDHGADRRRRPDGRHVIGGAVFQLQPVIAMPQRDGGLQPAVEIRAALERVATVLIAVAFRSEEHTSELQSLMRISYAVFCLKKKKKQTILNKTLSAHATMLA